jgi:hypothetical protein
MDLGGKLAHHLRGGGDLANGLLLDAQAGDQRGHHHGRHLAAHDQRTTCSISSWKISRCSMVRCSASWGLIFWLWGMVFFSSVNQLQGPLGQGQASLRSR